MITSVWIGDIAGNATDGNADVIVLLEDGRAYGFTAFTPEALRRSLTDEGIGCFVCPDLMVLAEINEANVREAIAEMTSMNVLDRIGSPQSDAL